ncbi:PAS domain-containing protein cky-1-like isoform X4 [Artemia franciscana]|uniref:PAS domain-containing protein cky-1-like isoform X4 n=1 Tax=Artemia franciscana TaxID=6661 RepID=UPI0032DB75E0
MELKRQKKENAEMQSLKKELDKMNLTCEKEASRVQEMETALEEKEGEKLTLMREIDERKEKLASSSEVGNTSLPVLKPEIHDGAPKRIVQAEIVIVEGHYLVPMALSSRPEPVLLAVCTPVAMPETREAVIQGACNVFTTQHSMDMKILEVDRSTEHYLGYSNNYLQNVSWYDLLHWDCLFDAQAKHKLDSDEN